MVNKTRLKIYGVLGGTFLLGAVAGGATSFAFAEHKHRAFVTGGREMFEQRRLAALSRELDLTEEQRARVLSTMRKHREEQRRLTRELFDRCGAPVREQKARVEAEIRAILTPDQQRRFDELVDEYGDGFLGGRRGRRPPH
jgi:Spy/CpxP family protein refolding chaperone